MGPRRPLTAATVLALSLGLAACGGGSSDGLATGEDFSVLGALAELPPISSDASLMVSTGDLVGASELADLELPESDEDVVAWIGTITGTPQDGQVGRVFVPLASMLQESAGQSAEVSDELGWSLLDVRAFAEVNAPPQKFLAVAGDFDDDTLSGLPEVVDGVATAGEGEDLSMDPNGTTPARRLGQPLRMAQDGSVLAASPSTQTVQQWVAGETETLADDEAYAAVAAALDEADVVGALLGPGQPFSPAGLLGPDATEDLAAQMEQMRDQLVAAPFDVVGLGFGVEEDDAVVTVVYHFGTDAAAADAVPVLETLYAEGTSLQTGGPFSDHVVLREAAADGPVAVVTLDVPADRPPSTILSMYSSQELPFMHQ